MMSRTAQSDGIVGLLALVAEPDRIKAALSEIRDATSLREKQIAEARRISAAVDVRVREADAREADLNKRTEVLVRREAAVAARERAVEEADLDGKLRAIAEREQAAAKREQRLDGLTRELRQRESVVEARERDLESRTEQIAKLFA